MRSMLSSELPCAADTPDLCGAHLCGGRGHHGGRCAHWHDHCGAPHPGPGSWSGDHGAATLLTRWASCFPELHSVMPAMGHHTPFVGIMAGPHRLICLHACMLVHPCCCTCDSSSNTLSWAHALPYSCEGFCRVCSVLMCVYLLQVGPIYLAVPSISLALHFCRNTSHATIQVALMAHRRIVTKHLGAICIRCNGHMGAAFMVLSSAAAVIVRPAGHCSDWKKIHEGLG